MHTRRRDFPDDLVAKVGEMAEAGNDAPGTAVCIKILSELNDPKLAELRIAFRNLFIMQVTQGQPMTRAELDATFATHFDDGGYTDIIRSQLMLAYRRVFDERAAGGPSPRKRKARARVVPIVFRALTGEIRESTVGKEATVGDMQETVCALFGKPYPGTTVSFAVNDVVIDAA